VTRVRWIVGVAAFLLVASAVAGVAVPRLASAADPTARSITVGGDGTATTTPDRASFEFGVQSQADGAKAAMAKTAATIADVLAAIRQSGVAASDVQTTGVWLYPRTTITGSVTGYDASNSVMATTAVANAGALVDAAVAAGATSVWGPNMLVSDERSLYSDALKNAVADAQANAQAIAAAAGLTLGPVQSVSEGGTPSPPIGAAASATPSAGASTPVVAGTRSVDAHVTVVYSAG
jgi:uncharacterized protein YggE